MGEVLSGDTEGNSDGGTRHGGAEILPEAHRDRPARSTLLYTVVEVGFIRLVAGVAA